MPRLTVPKIKSYGVFCESLCRVCARMWFSIVASVLGHLLETGGLPNANVPFRVWFILSRESFSGGTLVGFKWWPWGGAERLVP